MKLKPSLIGLLWLALGSLILATLQSCRRAVGYDNEKVYIGEIVSLTGSESTFGTNSHRGVMLAIKEANQSGGIEYIKNGQKEILKVELIFTDNASDRDKTRSVMKSLVEDENVLAVIGEVVSERTKQAAPIAQKLKVPLISPAATNPAVTEIGDYIFRACFIDPFQGYAMAKFSRKNLKLKKVAVLQNHRSNYSAGLSEYFIDTFIEMGGEILAEETYLTNDTDFTESLQKIKKLKPDAIFIPGYYTQVTEIAKQVRNLNIRSAKTGKPIQLLGGDGWDSPELNRKSKGALEGSYFTTHFTAESKEPRAITFVKKYFDEYGEQPDGQAAMGYDAAGILISAIRNAFVKYSAAENLRKYVRDEIAKTKDYPGVTGAITLNENRNAVKPAVVLRVNNGSRIYVTTVKP